MEPTIRVWLSASKNLRNIRIGFNAQKWAVSEIDDASMNARFTKSRRMSIGEHGLIYCSENQSFTMPFTILSKPRFEKITDVWPEPWGLPFSIEPLGSPGHRVPLYSAKRSWRCLHDVRNPTHRLNGMNGKTVFVPNDIPEEDWQSIIRHLGFRPNDSPE